MVKIGKLFDQVIEVFSSRFWTLVGIRVIPFAVVSFLLIIFMVAISFLGFLAMEAPSEALLTEEISQNLSVRGALTGSGEVVDGLSASMAGANLSLWVVLFFASFVVIFLAVLFLLIWPWSASLHAIRDREEKIGIIESYKRGLSKILSLFWASFLYILIISGLFLIFILIALVSGIYFLIVPGLIFLIFPGILFAVWFWFFDYVLIVEGKKGANALARSRDLVSGHGWEVLGRLIILILIILAVTFVGELILERIIVLPIIGILISVLGTVLLQALVDSFRDAFGYMLYEDLIRVEKEEG